MPRLAWEVAIKTAPQPVLVTLCGCGDPACWWVVHADMSTLRRYAEDTD